MSTDLLSPMAEDEAVEGLEAPEDTSWADYPIDTLLIREDHRTVHDVVRRMEKGSFIMDPEFQRSFLWSDDKQSKLIESVLMRIPLPVFYLAEDQHGKMMVVDGLQRLSTFQRFVNNDLPLKLPKRPELNGKCFKDLPPKLQNRVEDSNLTLYIIDSKVPERALLDIFERVNAGVPLTRQQMRNSLFMGKGTRFLKEEASTELFKEATGGSLKENPMRDREFVNRFCAFRLLSLEEYRGDMDDFLELALKRMNGLADEELGRLSCELRTGLANNLKLFGRHAFRKHTPGQEKRSAINASLWDVMSTELALRSEALVEAHANAVRDAFYSLLADREFDDAITIGTSQTIKVKCRFEKATAKFREVFCADTD